MKKYGAIWKSGFLIVMVMTCLTVAIQNSHKIAAQEVKEDECNQLFQKAEKIHKECFGISLLDTLVPKLVDSFGITNLEVEWARLDNFFIQLNNDPQTVGYIVVYGGRVNKFGELKERPKTLKNYIKNRGFEPDRIIFVEGGFREKFEYEFWISPSNKIFPPLSPTIELEKVKFRGKMKPVPLELGS